MMKPTKILSTKKQQLKYIFTIVKFVLFFIVIIAIIFLLYYTWYYNVEQNEYYTISLQTRSIENDGFCVLYNSEYAEKTTDIPSHQLERDALQKLPEGYGFLDYIYTIKNTSLSTFHRDVTSSQNTYGTKYPVYTLILYKYHGELLSICPNSHTTYPFTTSQIVNISGKSGTAFLFDCDVLHAGCINECKEREVFQYKLCHYEDIAKLRHLNGVRTTKIEEDGNKCQNDWKQNLTRKASYFFEMPINYLLYPFMIRRENPDSTFVGKIQSYIPMDFYNNPNPNPNPA